MIHPDRCAHARLHPGRVDGSKTVCLDCGSPIVVSRFAYANSETVSEQAAALLEQLGPAPFAELRVLPASAAIATNDGEAVVYRLPDARPFAVLRFDANRPGSARSAARQTAELLGPSGVQAVVLVPPGAEFEVVALAPPTPVEQAAALRAAARAIEATFHAGMPPGDWCKATADAGALEAAAVVLEARAR